MTGCTASALPELDRDATAQDALPSYVELPEGFDPSTSRFVATSGDVDLWLVGGGSGEVCLAAAQTPALWVAGCGIPPVEVSGDGIGHFALATQEPGNATAQLSDSVWKIG